MPIAVKSEALETDISELLKKVPNNVKVVWKRKRENVSKKRTSKVGRKPEANKKAEGTVSVRKNEKITQKNYSNLQMAVRTILGDSNATPINCHTGTSYRCCFCYQTFRCPAELKKHNIQTHADDYSEFTKGVTPSNFFVKFDITDLKCNNCSDSFNTVDDLIEHLNSVHDKNILRNVTDFIFPFIFNGDELKCTKCQNTYNSFKMLQEHMNIHYKNFVCDTCNAGFVTQTSFGKHVHRHKVRKVMIKRDGKELEETKHVKTVSQDEATNYVRRNYLPSIREILLWSNATAIDNHSGTFYKCSLCYDQFQSPADLKKHNLETHRKDIGFFKKDVKERTFYVKMDITNLQCNICNKEISSIDELLDHLNGEHDKNLITEVKKLIFPFKFDSEELRCCICFKIFYTFKHLQEHMHVHYSNHICEVCSAGFVTISSLKIHQGSHKIGTFKCSKCTKTFETVRTKILHEQYVHDASSLKNVCRVCGERFKDYLGKKRHLVRVHGVGALEFRCQSCEKVFSSRRGLSGHVQSYHLMLRPHECQECDKSFFSVALLKKHMLTHTGQKDYQCDVCSKKFGRKFTLMEHMRIHLNDRKFKCTLCKQAFVQKCSLKGHMRSKHGVELSQ